MSDGTAIVERLLAAYNRHDGAAFAECFSEDGVFRPIGGGEVAEGRDQIAMAMEEVWQAFPDWTLETRGLHDCGDAVFVPWTITATHQGEFRGIPPTNRSIEMLGCSHFTLAADGSVAQDDVYHDVVTMQRQLGVLPEPEATQPS